MPIIEYKTNILENSPSSWRTTIPKGVRDLLNLQTDDSLIWEVDVSDDGIKVSVKKADK